MQDILINWAPQETRVAVVESGAVQELHIERTLERGRVGNIYTGKVASIVDFGAFVTFMPGSTRATLPV